MTKRNLSVWVWLLLLPGLLGSWGGWKQSHFSEENTKRHSPILLAAGAETNTRQESGPDQNSISDQNSDSDPGSNSDISSGSSNNSGPGQKSDSDEPALPAPSPLFFSAAHTTYLPTGVLLGSPSSTAVLNWSFQDLQRCRFHSINDQRYTTRHISRLWQRALRLRTWFTCIMPAQAP